MTLNVPLTVRLGDRHITRHVQGLSFRKEAIGGLRNITFRLARPIASLDADLAAFTKVYIYDGRSAECIAQARLSDSGRSAGDGQGWEVAAFGPAQHMSDITSPIIYIDRSISDGWQHVDVVHPAATIGAATKPGDSTAAAPQGILANFSDGITVATESRVVLRYKRVYEAGQVLGGFQFNWDASATSVSWHIEAVTRTDGGVGEVAATTAFNTAGGPAGGLVGAAFPAGRNTLELRIRWSGGAATTVGDTWGWFDNIVIRPQLLLKGGADRAAADHGNAYILAHDVIEDILGRWGASFDGANAVIDQTGAHQIQQLVYPDGVNGEQVLADLITLEPGHRWHAGPDTTGNGYSFRWEPWPTTVRYEATLDDGGSFPLPGQNLYNAVSVRWVAPDGTVAGTLRTMACPILDEAGITRHALLNLGSEVGNSIDAARAGDTFLAEHNVPANSGTLTIARPIRDIITGRMVDPWEIEAGELVRVRGVESYPDALNADSNDGQTVFRIFAMQYDSESNSASLELDADPHTVVAALKRLLSARSRG